MEAETQPVDEAVEGPRRDIEDVRGELRRLGYLSDRFDRFLLQDVGRRRASKRALLAAALRVAALAGVVVSAVLALVLAAVNGNLAATPFDLLPLFLHLLPPVAVGAGLAFLLLSSLLLVILRLYPVRRIETLSLLTAAVAAAALGVALAERLLELAREGIALPWLVVAAILAALVVAAVAKVVHGALLALVMRWTREVPERPALARRWAIVGLLVLAGLLFLPPALAARQRAPVVPASIPTAPGEAVLVVGVDGVLGEEVDYLLAAGGLPEAARLLSTGGRLYRYPRPEVEPATFWTSLATGRAAIDHGVTSVDSFRPLGVATPLSRSGPLRPYWSRVAVPLGLAEYRPLLSGRRHAHTAWELAARGGDPVVAVDWWSTFPAEPLPGLVVAHGAYSLLDAGLSAEPSGAPEGASHSVPEGVVQPEARRDEIAALARRVAREVESPGGSADARLSALPAAAREFLVPAVVAADRFYRQAFLTGLEADTRAAALYLPGADIAAEGWRWAELALADLVTAELAATDAALTRALTVQRPGTVALVFDPGRRSGAEGAVAEGRVLLWRRDGCAGADGALSPGSAVGTGSDSAAEPGDPPLPEIDPRAVASGLLRALGLPQSGELPPPPSGCSWPSAPARLDSFGGRPSASPAVSDPGEYLESLRSLGYL